MAKGQIYGGVAMALGYGLFEEFELEEGVPTYLNFEDYLIPTAKDMPQVVAILVENPDPLTPYGVKSLGEPTNEILAPAIANAVFHATGRRIRELPITLEAVVLGRKLRRGK
jgi:CO/xanthine dehydrogenase Mo-binding subunit